MTDHPIPLVRPNPPRLSEATDALRAIEASGLFSNFGPVNTRFEHNLCERMFEGVGRCLTVCNATVALMMAIRDAVGDRPGRRRFALMPSFTFAAAAQAALWCGLTPLFCDIDPATWAADPSSEDELLRRYRGRVAVVVPYAAFGFPIDLGRYEQLRSRRGIPVVIDAAASLGTIGADGQGFGTGFSGPVVFSMHATKSFSTGEGGVIYSGDAALIDRLRVMCNFGFGRPRNATALGLNGKLSEVGALLAELRLADYADVVCHRQSLVAQYRAALPELTFQPDPGTQQAHQFVPALLPPEFAPTRAALQARLKAQGIDTATYFSPHVAEQDYFRTNAVGAPLPVTDDIASRVISLPLFDGMTRDDLQAVVLALRAEFEHVGDDGVVTPVPVDAPFPLERLPLSTLRSLGAAGPDTHADAHDAHRATASRPVEAARSLRPR